MSKHFDKLTEGYQQFLGDFLNDDLKSAARERALRFLVDDANLGEEAQIQAAFFSYVSSLLAEAKRQRNMAKLETKVVEANLKRLLRADNPKMTVDAVSSEALCHPDYLKAQAEYFAKEALVDHLEADVEAARQKAQMLQLFASTLRREQFLKDQIH